MTADDNEEGEAESREVEEPPPPGSPLTLLARKAKGDVGTLRKIVRNDFNTLELQLLRGDPTLSAARDLLRWLSGGEEEAAPLSEDSLQAMQLREQFEKNWEDGALPRDPVLVRSLLEQAKRDPELVARLILEAKDPSGRDLKARESGARGADHVYSSCFYVTGVLNCHAFQLALDRQVVEVGLGIDAVVVAHVNDLLTEVWPPAR